jgi:hypothetical protein
LPDESSSQNHATTTTIPNIVSSSKADDPLPHLNEPLTDSLQHTAANSPEDSSSITTNAPESPRPEKTTLTAIQTWPLTSEATRMDASHHTATSATPENAGKPSKGPQLAANRNPQAMQMASLSNIDSHLQTVCGSQEF